MTDGDFGYLGDLGDLSIASEIVNSFMLVALGQHPEQIVALEKYRAELCSTARFCCGPCNCNLPPCNGPECPDSGCVKWWDRKDECGYDPTAEATEQVLGPINRRYAKSLQPKEVEKLLGGVVYTFSNMRAGKILRNQMLSHCQGILEGIIYDFLMGYTLAGAITRLWKIYSDSILEIMYQANAFTFTPYNPPPPTPP